MEAKLGNYVTTGMHSHKGRVVTKYHNFKSTNESMEWFKGLEPRPPVEAMEENWYSILCYDGGAIMTHESDIVEVSRTSDKPLNNAWEDHYFDM